MAANNNSTQVNTLNIFLVIFSLILAFIFPFELFILAYAVLGPLHYITEINWLEKKRFFAKRKESTIILLVLTFLISIPFVLDGFPETHEIVLNSSVLSFLKNHAAGMALTALITALSMVFTKKWWIILTVMLTTFLATLPLTNEFGFQVLVGAMLPSLVHVYVFTILFMLYGALKESSRLGYFSVIMMLVVPLVIIISPVNHIGVEIGDYFLDSYNSSKFSNVNYSLGWTMGITGSDVDYYILNNTGQVMSTVALKIQIFIAFAYTYHYLNWFSKTTVIGWHKVISKRRLMLLLGIWIISVGFYFYNYYAGFLLLLFLSYLHVLMEFPLNWISIKEITRAVFRK